MFTISFGQCRKSLADSAVGLPLPRETTEVVLIAHAEKLLVQQRARAASLRSEMVGEMVGRNLVAADPEQRELRRNLAL